MLYWSCFYLSVGDHIVLIGLVQCLGKAHMIKILVILFLIQLLQMSSPSFFCLRIFQHRYALPFQMYSTNNYLVLRNAEYHQVNVLDCVEK